MKESTYRDLISGVKRGIVADAARGGLKIASLVYGAAVRLRNRAYDVGLLRVRRAPIPVVSVGNLTTGGTGKTPIVALVADWFTQRGLRPVILSRGYRALPGAINDEKLVLDQMCPGIVHLQSPDRVQSAKEACTRHDASLLILDDGFQHRRLARDLDIVLIDVLDPWGGGRVLPRGLLREPLSALTRADLIVLTRADQCSSDDKSRLIAEICRAGPSGPLIEVVFRPFGLVNFAGVRVAVDPAAAVAAFCGIGNPEGFRRTLADAGARRVVGFRAFPDHHHYTESDLANLAHWARECGCDMLITTQKDLVKIPRCDLQGVPLWSLPIRAQIMNGADRFEASLQQLLANAPNPTLSKFK